jgi:hypothetical protein
VKKGGSFARCLIGAPAAGGIARDGIEIAGTAFVVGVRGEAVRNRVTGEAGPKAYIDVPVGYGLDLAGIESSHGG